MFHVCSRDEFSFANNEIFYYTLYQERRCFRYAQTLILIKLCSLLDRQFFFFEIFQRTHIAARFNIVRGAEVLVVENF